MARDNVSDALEGRIVRALRVWRSRDPYASLATPSGRRGPKPNHFSKSQFYLRCMEAESEVRGATVHFAPVTEVTRVDRIDTIERKGLKRGEHEIVSMALGLPANFFSRHFASEDEALRTAKQLEAIPSERPKPMGFRRIDPEELNPDYRQSEFKVFEAFAGLVREGQRSLLLVEGPKGVGKTFLLSQWFWSVAELAFAPAISIDCAGLSLDQIFPLVWDHLAIVGMREPGLLVLDGLRVEREAGAVTLRLPERHAGIAELNRILNRLWQDLADAGVRPAGVIVALENNGKKFKHRELGSDLAPDAIFTLLRIEPLDPETSATFLELRGLTTVSHEDRRRLASSCQGLPGALAAIADEVVELSGLERERYLTAMRDTPRARGRDSAFLELFVGWLARHGAGESDESGDAPNRARAHPHAMLRLLAILMRPVSLGELEEIIAAVNIPRIFGRDIQDFIRGEYPFVRIVDDDLYELNPLAAQFLRDELARSVREDTFDSFTSRSQLERIHWTAATIRQRALRHEVSADAHVVANVEAFVYHVCQQIRLIAPGDSLRPRRRSVNGMPESRLREYPPGTLDRARLWFIAFHEAQRFLLDHSKQSTRVHAQFEAKARILADLVRVAHEEGIEVPIGGTDVRKEIALCWLHAGRLQLALDTITDVSAEGTRASRTADKWAVKSDRLSVETTIRMRLGQPVENIAQGLAQLLEDAIRIAETARGPGKPGELIPMQERGAIKILSRMAEIELLAGNSIESLNWFSKAEALQGKWSQPDGRPELLTGEAARRFVIALVRNRLTPDNMQRARDLLAANIERLERFVHEQAARPNDTISLRILDAGLSRISGLLPAAEFELAVVKADPLFQRREVTFQTRAEFDLEELRLDIIQKREPTSSQLMFEDQVRDQLRDRARDFAKRMNESGHRLLELDGLFLLAELLQGTTRDEHCHELKRKMSTMNQPMRQKDLFLLLQDRSPLLVLGL